MDNPVNQTFFILQCVNIAVIILFLTLFIWRLAILNNHSTTSRYKNLYPKPRILFAAIYIVISIALLVFNIAVNQFNTDDAWMYIFAGGGGQCINSIILIIQLIVLRMQLNKEFPYTPIHLIYSVYLLVISVARFIVTLYYLINDERIQAMQVNLFLSILLMIDSATLLGYWVAKRQQLPQFQDIKYFNFDTFRTQSSQLVQRHLSKNNYLGKNSQDDFPYIYPSLFIEKNKFRIILQSYVNQVSLQETNDRHSKRSKKLQMISQKQYNLTEIRQFYVSCGRLTLQSQVIFNDTSYGELFQSIRLFLDELFANKQNYQQFVLKFFKLSEQNLNRYAQYFKGSKTASVNLKPDTNAIYIQVSIYRQLWLEDHYEFYLRALTNEDQFKSHPMKRFSEFQQLDTQLKIISSKYCAHKLIFPPLPKKHLFRLDEQKINQRRKQLENYIRKLTNDTTIMESPYIREKILQFLEFKHVINILPHYDEEYLFELDIIKGRISKALVNSQYVTFYQFKIFKNGIEIGTINKRFRQFINLHEDLQRWMNNIQITYKAIELPQKHLYKSEANRHEKLRNYLRAILAIKESYKIYELGVFLNVQADEYANDETFSSISFIKRNSLKQSLSKLVNQKSSTKQEKKQIQMDSPSRSYSSSSNQRMSKLIQDLGKNIQE